MKQQTPTAGMTHRRTLLGRRRAGRAGRPHSFVSLMAPKGMDAGLREKIRADVIAVLQEPQVNEKLTTFAFEPKDWSVAQMQEFAAKKSAQYKLLIEKAHISLD